MCWTFEPSTETIFLPVSSFSFRLMRRCPCRYFCRSSCSCCSCAVFAFAFVLTRSWSSSSSSSLALSTSFPSLFSPRSAVWISRSSSKKPKKLSMKKKKSRERGVMWERVMCNLGLKSRWSNSHLNIHSLSLSFSTTLFYELCLSLSLSLSLSHTHICLLT